VAQSPDLGFPCHWIVEDLRTSILDGRLAPGARLSSEWRLAEMYQTSRPTVRRAMAVLKAEGLVVTKQGHGAFELPRRDGPPADAARTQPHSTMPTVARPQPMVNRTPHPFWRQKTSVTFG